MLDHLFALEGGTVTPRQEAGRQGFEADSCVLFATVREDGGPNRTVLLRP